MMEIEIIEREEQGLMDREEITVEITHHGEATPSTAAVRDRIAAELDLDPKTVEVAGIHSSTGLSTSTGTVRVHDEPIYDELPEDDEEGAAEDAADEAAEADGDTDDAAEEGGPGDEDREEEPGDEAEDDTDTEEDGDAEEDAADGNDGDQQEGAA